MSRTALTLLLSLSALPLPALPVPTLFVPLLPVLVLPVLVLSAPAPLAAQSPIPIDADVLGPIARRQALERASRSRRDPGCDRSNAEEIVVCARGRSTDFRVPDEPQPGAPLVRAMGELPRPGDLGGECHRLCHQPVGVSVDVGRLIADPGGALRQSLRGRR